MRYLLEHLDEVSDMLLYTPFGLVTDVDGTISTIAPTPQQAVLSEMCRRYLTTLADKLDLMAVVSGRALTDVMGMVGIEGLVYVGNHGLEVWNRGVPDVLLGAQGYIDIITSAIDSIRHNIDIDGLVLEEKGITASIHYRNAKNPISARENILEAIKGLPQIDKLRMTEGKMVVELRPDIDINKGTALKALINKYELAAVIYIGDDVTDIDAFDAVHHSGIKGIAIAVVSDESPQHLIEKADYVLRGVDDVERFLGWLALTLNR